MTRSRGAVGTIFVPATKREAQDRRDDWDEDGEQWRSAVAAEQTDMSMEEWHECTLGSDGDDVVFDLSYYDLGIELCDKLNAELPEDHDEYELAECVGGGRCFSVDMKWDELYNHQFIFGTWTAPTKWNLEQSCDNLFVSCVSPVIYQETINKFEVIHTTKTIKLYFLMKLSCCCIGQGRIGWVHKPAW